jgi:hypothetical protein
LVGQALMQRMHCLAAQQQGLQPGKISLQKQTWRGHGTSGSSQESLDQVARFWKLPRTFK